jgi:eukaryotic-like serine/threonine-protein kinase
LGGTWTASGSILFTPGTVSPIMRVAAAGGAAEALTQLTSGQTSHTLPIALPDGRHCVFSVLGTPAAQGIYLGSVDKAVPKKLLAAAAAGAFLPPDRLAYFLAGRIVTQRMDLATEALVGEPTTMAASTIGSVNVGGLALSASANGILAYRSGVSTHRALMWRDRSGKLVARAGNAVDQFPALSPDGRAIAGTRSDFDIWLTDVARNSEMRWTFDPAIDALPVWSPDSRRLAFASNRTGTFAIYLGPVSQPGSEERLFVSQYPTIAQDWSSDGRWLLYYENRPGVGRDLWALDMIRPDRKRRPVAVTPAEETLAKFSPDGRWVAYQTNASGRFEIVVKAFGDGAAQGGMWQVSRNGGVAPVWSRDGKELYFFAPDGSLQASSITAGTDTIEAGSPVRLFMARVGGAGGIDAGTVYCVSRDGRFLISEVVDADVPPITIVVNPRF